MLAWGVLPLLGSAVFANTEVDVPNATTNLNSLTTSSASDLTFTNITYSSTAFTAASALSIGTLDDLDATQTLGITGAGTITLNGGANVVAPNSSDLLYVASGGTLTVANAIALTTTAANGNFDVAGSSTLSGIVSGAGFGYTKTGAGILTLTGTASTYSGGTTVSAGEINVSGTTSSSSTQNAAFGSGLVTVSSAGTLALNPSTTTTQYYANNFTLDGGTVTSLADVQHLGSTGGSTPTLSTITVTSNGGQIITRYGNGSSNTLYVDGQLTGSGALTINNISNPYNSGIVHFTDGANTYSGVLTISAPGTGPVNGVSTTLNGGAISIDANNALQDATLNVLASTRIDGTQNAAGTTATVFFGTGVSAVTLAALEGSGNIALPTSGSLTVGNGTSTTYSGVLSGTGASLIKAGTGTLTLQTSGGSYSGGTTISAGAISVTTNVSGQDTALGTGLVTISSAGTLLVGPTASSSNSQYFANSFSIDGGTILASDDYEHFGSTGGSMPTLGTINITANGGRLLSEYSDKPVYVDGQLTGSGALTIDNLSNQYSAGIIHFTDAANTYSGTITLNGSSSGTLNGVSESFTGGSISIDASTALQNATLNLASGDRGVVYGTGVTAVTIGGLSGVTNLALPTTSLTVGGMVNGSSTAYSGVLSGTGSNLIKAGAGTLTLSGANTYTGSTSVNGGVLAAALTNALAKTSGITAASSSTLSLTANSALATPSTFTAGTGGTAGTTTTTQVPVTLSGGTLLRNGTGVSAGSGSMVGVGVLTLTSASTLDFGTTGVGTLNFNGLSGLTSMNTLTVLDFSRTTTGTTPGTDGTDDRLIVNQNISVAGELGDINFNGSAAQQIALGNGEFEIIAITAVPEPSTWIGGLIALAMLGYSRRRSLQFALAVS